jgi:hypothetical protein
MDGKPSDFFLTLTSFFAILLPGTMLAFLALGGLPQPVPTIPAVLPGTFGPWLAFLVASYLAGQLLYALGSWLLDPLYDWMDLGFKLPERRERLKNLEASVRKHLWKGAPGSILPKTRALILARGPQSWPLVEQADADAKFFRAVTIVAAWGAPIALLSSWGWRLGAMVVGSFLVAASSLVFRLVSCRYSTSSSPSSRTEVKGSLPSREWGRFEGWLCSVSALRIAFSYGVLIVWTLWAVSVGLFVAAGLLGGIGGGNLFLLAACWGLMLISFFRYNQRRADRDKTALECAMELADAPAVAR